MNLNTNQKEAIKKFSKLKVGALFMEAGTGKTLTAYNIIKPRNCDYVLWITPCPTKENLKVEIEKYGGLENLEIVGTESIQSSDRVYIEIYEKMRSKENACVVVDEAFKIKNANAKRSKRINELGKLAQYRLILNGTPLAKNYLDIHNQINFLSPKILNMGFTEYKNTFVEYVKIKYKVGNRKIEKEYIKDYHNLDYLYSLIEPYVYDCKLDMNKNKKYINIPVYATSETEQLYYDTLDDFEERIHDEDSYIKMTQSLQHKYSLDANKIEAIKEHVDSKTIIFVKFVETKETLQAIFPNALVLTYSTGAAGLNLQEYNKIVFYDKTFDYLQREQAEHRIYRIGQANDCTYVDLTLNLPLDKIIDRNIDKKIKMGDYFKTLLKEGAKWQQTMKSYNQ